MSNDLEIKTSGDKISLRIPNVRGEVIITKPWHITKICYWNKKRWEISTDGETAVIELPNYILRIWYEGDIVAGTFEKRRKEKRNGNN